MAGEPPPPPPAKLLPTTISDLSADDLLEILLRLPNLLTLVRAAFTCRWWLRAVRSSRPFRRLFRALHPAPLIGLFVDGGAISTPAFVPVRRYDPDATAALRRGDFFLTSLPHKSDAYRGWTVCDCREGRMLLWDIFGNSLLVVNPMAWAVDILPMPPGDDYFAYLGFHLLCSDEKPQSSFGVVCIYADIRSVRVAILSPGTRDWIIHPTVDIGGDNRLQFKSGSLVDGSVYWPYRGEKRMIRIDTATMDISSVDLPSEVTAVLAFDFKVGETKDGELCIAYASDFLLHVWIRGADGDGVERWVPHKHKMLSLSAEIRRIITGDLRDLQGHLNVLEVRAGFAYLEAKHMFADGMDRSWFFSLSLETTKLELLIQGTFENQAYPYIMGWPPSLVADEGSLKHEGEGSEVSV